MRAKSWVKELQRQASPNIVIALSGNKADLAGKRMVDFEVHLYTHTLYTVNSVSDRELMESVSSRVVAL